MATDYGKTISKNLRRILFEKDISAADMSRDTGLAKSTISNWMSGNRIPRGETIDLLCNYLNIDRSDLVEEDAFDPTKVKSIKVKVYGQVAAGIPMEMIEDIIDEEEIPADWLRGGKEYFGLVIHGDSMSPRMKEGDVIIVRKQPDAETGETVIATVNGFAATCKVLRKHRDGIELLPTNPAHEPQFFSDEEVEDLPVKILGRVVELRAKY